MGRGGRFGASSLCDWEQAARLQENASDSQYANQYPYLAAIAEGRTSQHVAYALHVSLLTIETHRRNLLTKFGVNSTALLIRQAAQLGLP